MAKAKKEDIPAELLSLGPDDSLWPSVRSALVEGARLHCESSMSAAFPKAVAQAKLCGLWEKARLDPRWAAQGILEATFDGREELLSLFAQATREMGLSWKAVAPWALEGWIARSQSALAWPEPLAPMARDTPLQDRPWTWMAASLRMWAKGWDGVAGGRKAPLDGAWSEKLEELFGQVWQRCAKTEAGRRQVEALFNLAPELGGAEGLKARLEARKIAAASAQGVAAPPKSRL